MLFRSAGIIPYRVKETFGYQNQAASSGATTISGSATVSNWTASYTGAGGNIKVTMNFTAWATSVGAKVFNLQRDGVTVAAVNFYFNNTNIHYTMPTIFYLDTSGNTSAHSYSLVIPAGVNVDVQDCATMIITEY